MASHPAEVTFSVDGTPKPKGSMRHVGQGRMVEQLRSSAPWRERTLWAAKNAAGPSWQRLDGPVSVTIHCYYDRPKSAPKRRPWAPTTRTSGDADKLARNILDALVDAGLMRDDSQVTSLVVRKLATGEGSPTLDNPGAVILVEGTCE